MCDFLRKVRKYIFTSFTSFETKTDLFHYYPRVRHRCKMVEQRKFYGLLDVLR